MVPSLNAANVWMMEQFANILSLTGNDTGAAYYMSRAERLALNVLRTYAGGGVWKTSYPNGTS
jgi:hypothetical protein